MALEENFTIDKMNIDINKLTSEDFQFVQYKKKNAQKIRHSLGFWEDVFRRFKKNKRAIGAIIVLLAIVLICTIAPIFIKHTIDDGNLKNKNLLPSLTFWFGTDELGRDLFVRVCFGGRVSLFVAFVGAIIDICIGMLYGGISAYAGGKIDTIMMRIVEILLSIPYLILSVLISLIFGKGIFSLIIAMTITGWCFSARLVRGQVLQLKNQDFILAAQVLGTKPLKIITRHLLPNIFSVMIVALTFAIPSFIFGEAFLSYIGLGIQPPYTSWGVLAAESQKSILFYPYQLFFPALFISLTVFSLQIIGDALRDAMDPQLRMHK